MQTRLVVLVECPGGVGGGLQSGEALPRVSTFQRRTFFKNGFDDKASGFGACDGDYEGEEARDHRVVWPGSFRYGVARGADCPADGPDQRFDRSLQEPREGPRQPPRAADDGLEAFEPAEVPAA